MGSCASKVPKIKTHKRRPTANPPQKEFSQLHTADTEDAESVENGGCPPSQFKSKAPTKLLPITVQTHLTDPSAQEAAKTSIHVAKNEGVCAKTVYVRDIHIYQKGEQNGKAEPSKDFTPRFTQIQEMLKRNFRIFKMKGLPWMKGVNLTLEKHYVKLKMTTSDSTGRSRPPKNTTIEETFIALEGQEDPFRILVEGGPGFGKTTLAAKLAYDWAQNTAYVRHFDIVVFIPLRHFTKGWRETLKLAAGLRDDDDGYEMMLKILKDNKKRFLLIFDGYDELPEAYLGEINAIIQQVVLPDVTVVVTSRPGKFTSSMEEKNRDWFMQPADVVLDANQLFNKRIVITGFDDCMQEEFVKTHTTRFSNTTQHSVLKNIERMQNNRVLTTEFLQCPLFLLMIILLLLENRNSDIQSFKTRTDLYKSVFNFVVRRYFSKTTDSTTSEVDLFSDTRDKTSAYISIMIQLSNFALYAVEKNVFAFSKEEIFKNCGEVRSIENPDSKELTLLNLGFLTESVLEDGFLQETVYEPIHKSLLEFAAAYCLWSSFLDGRHDHWQNQVRSLRPRKVTKLNSTSSLVIPFLSGMMGKDVWNFFNALRPYAAEYSLWFETLYSSLYETQITPELLGSLAPLLPLEISVCHDRSSFSRYQEQIICYGTRQEIIKIVTWDPVVINKSFLRKKMVIERFVVELRDPSWLSLFEFATFCIQCLHLWVCLFPLPLGLSPEEWESAIFLTQAINFRRISFVIYSASFAISRIYAAVKSGVLQHSSINCIRYFVERNCSYLDEVSELICANKVETIELILYSPEDTSPDQRVYTPLTEKDCLGECCQSVSQEQMDHFVKCASQSTKLGRFVIENNPRNPLVIDMSLLCDRGYKSWKLVSLKGVTVYCGLEMKKSFQIGHLQLSDANINTSLDLTKNLWRFCHVASFACGHQTLLGLTDLPTVNNSLKELKLQVNDAMNLDPFLLYPNSISNLQILVLEVTSFVSEIPLLNSIEELFPYVSSVLRLRGVELLGVENNYEFVNVFVHYIFGGCRSSRDMPMIEGQSEPDTLQKQTLHLEYFMLHIGISRSDISLFSQNESIVQFLSSILKLKLALKKELLPRLDVVCYKEVISYMWDIEEDGISSLNNIFPVSEGFSFENDFYGMRDDDSIHSKELYERTPYPYNRLTIQFNGYQSSSS